MFVFSNFPGFITSNPILDNKGNKVFDNVCMDNTCNNNKQAYTSHEHRKVHSTYKVDNNNAYSIDKACNYNIEACTYN